MTRVSIRHRLHEFASSNRLAVMVRGEQRYAEYPHYAVLLAAAVWLFGQLPAGTDAMAVVMRSPALLTLAGALWVGGSALACALSLVGVWRPGRANVALSVLALALCCMPGLM